MKPLFKRLKERARESIAFTLDGKSVRALRGDTILTAILTYQSHLKQSDSQGEPRAGFCLMGACQDCWVMLESGERLRACTTTILPGMRIVTTRDRIA